MSVGKCSIQMYLIWYQRGLLLFYFGLFNGDCSAQWIHSFYSPKSYLLRLSPEQSFDIHDWIQTKISAHRRHLIYSLAGYDLNNRMPCIHNQRPMLAAALHMPKNFVSTVFTHCFTEHTHVRVESNCIVFNLRLSSFLRNTDFVP